MLVRLNCGYQEYDWGKLGSESLVAKFTSTNEGVKIDNQTPYAELWMGTHPKVCSQIVDPKSSATNLIDLIKQNKEVLGSKVAETFGSESLPYLFKVLSIRKALSIQAHPDKALAKQLHARDPKNYPDDNHKPEMAIALTDFEGFCGFRPLEEIQWFVEHVPEFKELVGADVAKQFAEQVSADGKAALKHLFNAVMNTPQSKIDELAPKLAERASKEKADFAQGKFGGADLAALLVTVDEQFPKDIGLFCGGLMLNYVRLSKGEAMFLRAKDPHAYISGDIIECMAASDNVVRAGFTPKFKDVQTLVDMLTYNSGSVKDQKMVPTKFAKVSGGQTLEFNPPIDEFSVLQHTQPSGEATFEGLTGPTVIIFTEGEGSLTFNDETLEYKPGYVFFAAANTKFTLAAKSHTVSYNAIAEI